MKALLTFETSTGCSLLKHECELTTTNYKAECEKYFQANIDMANLLTEGWQRAGEDVFTYPNCQILDDEGTGNGNRLAGLYSDYLLELNGE